METDAQGITRRNFLKNSVTAAAGTSMAVDTIGAPSIQSMRGANEKVRIGFIGVGNRGTQLLEGFLAQADCQVAALCDVYEPYLIQEGFIKRTPRGREATPLACDHLGKQRPADSQPGLFP